MTQRPNILFVFSDQQRWDTMGCYGQPLDVTPNLDRMAAEGVRFDRNFTCQPVCGPARACLQTGKYATELGCFKNDIALPLNEKTLAHYLAEVGYDTAYIGKWHLASERKQGIDYQRTAIPPERRGGYTDHWIAADLLEFTSHSYDGHLYDQNMQKVEIEGYRVDFQTNLALEYLRNRESDKPFFLFLSYLEPHHQNDHDCYEGPNGSKERFKNFTAPGDLQGLEGNWQKEYPDYLGCCASLDENVGKLRAELERLGLYENTVIIYTSDHGSHFHTRNRDIEYGNYDDYKRSSHEASIHTPLIISGPGFQAGATVSQFSSLLDLPPTIMTAAKREIPRSMKGRPLQEIVGQTAENWPDDVFVQISESQVGRAVRTDRWKYAVRATGKHGGQEMSSDVYTEYLLFDLQQDPHERCNLITEPALADVRREMAERLLRRMAEAGEAVPRILPAS